MSKQIHQLIIRHGSNVNIVCKDDLSAAAIYNIDKIYRFGGDLKFVECGTPAIWAGLYHAFSSMYYKMAQLLDSYPDDRAAWKINRADFYKFQGS